MSDSIGTGACSQDIGSGRGSHARKGAWNSNALDGFALSPRQSARYHAISNNSCFTIIIMSGVDHNATPDLSNRASSLLDQLITFQGRHMILLFARHLYQLGQSVLCTV